MRITLAAVVGLLATVPVAWAGQPKAAAAASQPRPGGPLIRSNSTPYPSSKLIVGARWTSGRYDPPSNQSGDILPTVWSDDGSTYVLMDDGGVDVPVSGGLWRHSFARIIGKPPNLNFKHIGDPFSPAPHTWAQIGGNPDNDDGPLGPYYSIGFVEAGGVFYATQQRNWSWGTNGTFTGLAGMAYSKDHGKTWRLSGKAFPAPLGNMTFIDGGGRGGAYPDGYIYAIGTEREFNASKLLLGRVQPGVANVTDPAHWQWSAGSVTGADGKSTPQWTTSLDSAVPVVNWDSHITYPQMTYDRPLHRYLLTFTYSYQPNPPGVWKGGAELVILESPTPQGPFSFVARSPKFGPSNGYGAGFPSEWISRDGRDLWLKWAANFAGCAKGLDCTGKYGFNIAKVHLRVSTPAKHGSAKKAHRAVAYVVSAAAVPLLLLAFAATRGRGRALRAALRRRAGPEDSAD